VDLHAAPGPAADLFGPFRSRHDALAALRGLSREHLLCPQVLGLEEGSGACSAYPLGQCRGICAGQEPRAPHTLRLAQALARLRLPAWPFPGPVAILEEDPFSTHRELHVAHHWRYLGSAGSPAEAYELAAGGANPPAFDVDIFRVLARALADTGRYRIERLPLHPARSPHD
jgi:DNA polymerase-3 subunit epsilon